MSDLELSALLDELEGLLQAGPVEGDVLASWQARLDATLATVERGSDWPQILARSRALALHLDQAANQLSQARENIRKELNFKELGSRALKGYKPS